MQIWFGLSDPAMEEALYEVGSMRAFAELSLVGPIPDETTILNFRRLLETHELAGEIFAQVNGHLRRQGLMLKRRSIVDTTIIAAPSSTKNDQGQRDAEMSQTKAASAYAVCAGQSVVGAKAVVGEDGMTPPAIG